MKHRWNDSNSNSESILRPQSQNEIIGTLKCQKKSLKKNSWRFWSVFFISRLEGHKDEAWDAKSLRAVISFSRHQFAFRLNFTRIRTHYFHSLRPSNPPLVLNGRWKQPTSFCWTQRIHRMTLSTNRLPEYNAPHCQAAPKHNKIHACYPRFP